MPTGQVNRMMPTLRRVVLAGQSAARSDGELLGAFVTDRDADAFAELVRRHGPMVLGVCRRVVGEHATADDAFQAAFLVLARRAASIRPREQVGNWLYGVAYRTAIKARMVLARRRAREKQVDVMPEPTAAATLTADWSDLQSVIDEELAKLPDKLRLPVVLCDLEGRPQREVAKHLKVPAATLATRLASARRTLAQRLTRRGVVLSGGALAGLLGIHGSASAVPPTLATGAASVGEAVAAGTSLHSLVSAHAVQLSEGVMRMMMLAKLKTVAVMAVIALTLSTGFGVGLLPAMAGDEPTTAVKAAPAAQPASFSTQLAAREVNRPEPTADDATFLRRLCLNVRGTPPTPMEMRYFVSDNDNDKRAKVVEWMVDDEATRVIIAKKLGVPLERVKVFRMQVANKSEAVVIVTNNDAAANAKFIELGFATQSKELVARNTTSALRDKPVRPLITNTNDHDSIWVDVPGVQQTIDRTVELAWMSDKNVLTAGDTPLRMWVLDGADENDGKTTARTVKFITVLADSDEGFLKRVLTDVRGSGPTALELKYFTEDKDPKKREKLLDTLLKDPAIQKKLGDAWKQKMLSHRTEVAALQSYFYLVPEVVKPAPATPGKYEKLIGELLAAKKSDEAILEALTLAALGRLPTESEKTLTLASIAVAKDRRAAWAAVAKALTATDKSKP